MSGGKFFEWDADKAALNFARNAITFQTAVLVFTDELRLEEYDFDGSWGKDSWQAIGKVENVVLIVFSDREDFTRITSARKATKFETERYEAMSTVKFFLPEGATPTPDQTVEIAELRKKHMLNFDRDCMPFPTVLNWEMDRLHHKYQTRRITKEIWQREHPDGYFSAPDNL